MRYDSLKKQGGLILVILIFWGFDTLIISQAEPVTGDKDKELRKEILDIYQAKGEQKVRDFYQKSKNRITNKFILEFTAAGLNERKEEWLKACEILAEEKKDEKTLADVLYQTGKYFMLVSDNKKASYYFDKTIPIYTKLSSQDGQGNVYHSKGSIYLRIGEYSKASEMYEKAIPFFKNARNPAGLGNVYLEKGDIYLYTGDKSKAFELYDKSLRCFNEVGASVGLGNVYLRKGIIYSSIGKYSKALEMYDEALRLFEKAGNPTGLGNIYKNKGMIYSHNGDNSKAIEMYDTALLFFEKAADVLAQGNLYRSKGDILLKIGEYSKALEIYDKSLTLLKRTGEPISLGNTYMKKGIIYSRIGKNSKALGMFDKALPFFKKAGNPTGLGNVYFKKGEIYSIIGEYSKAFALYDKAMHFYEKTGEAIGLGNVCRSKGSIYLYIEDNSKAIDMFNKALFFFNKVENQSNTGSVYIEMGDFFLRVREYSKALEMYDKALLFFEKAGALLGQGNAWVRRGDIFFCKGYNSKALEMYSKALTIFKKVGSPIGIGNVYFSKGDIYLNNGKNAKALEMYNKALPFFEKVGEPIGLGNSYIKIGDIYFNAGKNSKSIEMYDKALFFTEKAGAIQSASYALHGKARTLGKMGENNEAVVFFERGISTMEKVRKQTAFSEMKRSVMETVYKKYEETVLFMLENKHHEKAFKYAESMKARVFLDQMVEGLEKPDKGLNPELKEKRDSLVGKLSALSRQMQETPGNEEKKLHELKEQYRRVDAEFDDLLIKIRLENPLYASITYPQPISVKDLQTNVLKKGESLLSYFISKEKTFVFIVSKEKFRVKQLKVTENEINGLVNRHLQAINENNSRDIIKYGSLLHEKLFQPLEKYVKKSRDIIIVPSGELETIPFESLVTGKNKTGFPVFLLEKYRVKYLQSASLLSILRQHYKRDNSTQSFIGFGDPVYETAAAAAKEGSHKETQSNTKEEKPSSVPSVSSVAIESSPGENETQDTDTEHEILDIHRDRFARAGGSLPRLPNSGEEINTIARLFTQKGQKTRVFLRDQANEANAKSQELKDFAYIHFSCHGLLNDDFQCLVLSRDADGKEDGYLTLNEIMNCDFNAKLVVLSACMTGSGKKYKGEGVTGLTRAVMYAGSPAVIASLWKVDDFATKELMVNFYKNLLDKNLDKSEALRLAKLELLNTEKYSSPLYWSAFVLYGE